MFAQTLKHNVGQPSAEVEDLHAAHLAELNDSRKLVLAGPLVERSGGLRGVAVNRKNFTNFQVDDVATRRICCLSAGRNRSLGQHEVA